MQKESHVMWLFICLSSVVFFIESEKGKKGHSEFPVRCSAGENFHFIPLSCCIFIRLLVT